MPNDMTGKVQTVLGTIGPEELGPTTTHEHLLIDFRCMFTPPSEASDFPKAYGPVTMQNLAWVRYNIFSNEDNLLVGDVDTAIEEVELFRQAGGGTIVDATTIGIGRDPLGLARISRATGVNVVMGAGYYVGDTHGDDMNAKTEDELADQMVTELTEGVGATGVKAGIIGELGCSWPLRDNERKVLLAGAQAQQRTGAAILIHPGRSESAPAEIIEVLAGAGADVGRVIMSHLDRTVRDEAVVLDLASSGCYIEYDLFGWEISNYPLSDLDMISDAVRMAYVRLLVDKGYGERVVLAHDVFAKHRLVAYGGHGYAHILENIVPRLRRKGFTSAQLDNILVQNPARVLPFA